MGCRTSSRLGSNFGVCLTGGDLLSYHYGAACGSVPRPDQEQVARLKSPINRSTTAPHAPRADGVPFLLGGSCPNSRATHYPGVDRTEWNARALTSPRASSDGFASPWRNSCRAEKSSPLILGVALDLVHPTQDGDCIVGVFLLAVKCHRSSASSAAARVPSNRPP